MQETDGALIESHDFGRVVIDEIVCTDDSVVAGQMVQPNWEETRARLTGI
jgi:hypothetical protein